MTNFLVPDEIKSGLGTNVIGREVYCFRETKSTQTVAQELAQGGAEEGTVVLAEEQTAGKGRMGRNWFSPPGEGIWTSVILRPPTSPSQMGRVLLTCAVAVAEAIRKETELPALIKWPNDLLIGGRKVGGILTEMAAEMDRVKFVVVGIGINVNLEREKFPEELQKGATSLREEMGEEISRLHLLQEILKTLEEYYIPLKGGQVEKVANRWRQLSATLGRQIRASFQGEIIEGRATDIDSDGALLIRLDSGFVKRLLGGDVTLLEEE
ncbi:biotin--[acetyl-CoA-carboxylase] ligase [candidate division NPL-UPA2 bacterium]|nr:biotin--[acetyl-CoA-carboxylase] ligase [candidate division NPL-UPA2 bacterium]